MIVRFDLTLWSLDGVNLHFVSVFMILNVDLTVKYQFVCLYVVFCRD